MLFRITLLLILLSLLSSCRSNEPGPAVNGKPEQNQMEELNRYLIRKDRERIQNYIERKGLQMTESPTGLWYQIISQGEGNFIDNNRIVMEYDCSLLDGTKCYSSEDLGPMEVIPGRTSIPAGLYEGFRMLKPGAKAIFILPPFLAFGLPGDGKKIPPGSVVIYNVDILRAE